MALEAALLDGRVDLAVHSAKDVPTAEDPRLRDRRVSAPRGPARRAPLPRAGPNARHAARRGRRRDRQPAPRRLPAGAPARPAHAAAARQRRHAPAQARRRRRRRPGAGGRRADPARPRRPDHRGRSPRTIALPAPGQGALAIEVRADDVVTGPFVARLDDPATRAAVEAERALLRASGGGCRAPLGALAVVDGTTITIRGAAAAEGSVPPGDAPPTDAAAAPARRSRARPTRPSPRRSWPGPSGAVHWPIAWRWRRRSRPSWPRSLRQIRDARGRRSLGAPGPRRSPRALVTREPGRRGALAMALRERGLDPIVIPTIELRAAAPGGALDAAAASLAATRGWS